MIDDQWLASQLRARGIVTQSQLDAALHGEDGDLCQKLVANGAIVEGELLKFLGLLFQTRYVSTEKLSTAKIPQWVLELLPLDFCEKHLLIPVRCDKQQAELSIVTVDPSEAAVRENVQRISGVKEVRAYLGLRHGIEAAIRRYYRGDIHAFARMDQSLRQNFSDMMSIYEQRLIDFDHEDPAAPTGSLALSTDDGPLEVTHDALSAEPSYYNASAPVAPVAPSTRSGAFQIGAPQTGPYGVTAPTGPHLVAPHYGSPSLGAQPQLGSPYGTPGGGGNLEALMHQPAVTPSTRSLPSLPTSAASGMGGLGGATDSALLPLEGWVHLAGVLVNLLEAGQGWRQGHSAEVARLVGLLGERAGVDGETALMLRLAAFLHDLGKPPELHLTLLALEASNDARALSKKVWSTPSKLLEAARLAPELERTLSSIYERVDGHGTPGKRFGRDIPLGARLIAAVDAYCDLVANPRAPGGRTDDHEAAVHRLREAAQRKLFDPDVVSLLHQVTVEALRERLRGGRARVLLIDADVGATAVLEQQLSQSGCDVRVVRTTAEAALVVLSEKVDLVLSEVRLEPVDGFVFLERLRSDARTQQLPFIFISDRADAEDVNRGFELGALDYIVKPFTPEVLVAKIKRVLQG